MENLDLELKDYTPEELAARVTEALEKKSEFLKKWRCKIKNKTEQFSKICEFLLVNLCDIVCNKVRIWFVLSLDKQFYAKKCR